MRTPPKVKEGLADKEPKTTESADELQQAERLVRDKACGMQGVRNLASEGRGDVTTQVPFKTFSSKSHMLKDKER
jgi:hypothetical protein